mgnify:CR=1 FL=1
MFGADQAMAMMGKRRMGQSAGMEGMAPPGPSQGMAPPGPPPQQQAPQPPSVPSRMGHEAQAQGGMARGPDMGLAVGDEGEDVAQLQQQLGVEPDGAFGPETQAAVKDFQIQNGLEPTGVADQELLALLAQGSMPNDEEALLDDEMDGEF